VLLRIVDLPQRRRRRLLPLLVVVLLANLPVAAELVVVPAAV
jgi:hypothetical protein